MTSALRPLSQSAVACFRRCPREYQYRYVQLRRSKRISDALSFGRLWDTGLKSWLADNGTPESRCEAALVAMRSAAGEDTDAWTLIRAEELMIAYTVRWGESGYFATATAKQFRVPLVNPDTGHKSQTYELVGEMDAIVVLDGRSYQLEAKTTSRDITPGSDFWRRVSALDPQVSTYQSAAKASGMKLDGCLYDVVRKVMLRPRSATPIESRRYTKKGFLDARQRETDETEEEYRARVSVELAANPEKYFARGPVVRLEGDELEHAQDVWQTAWMLRESENAGRFPRAPNACERFGSYCDYFDVCSGTAAIDDDTRYRTAETAHEELAKEV